MARAAVLVMRSMESATEVVREKAGIVGLGVGNPQDMRAMTAARAAGSEAGLLVNAVGRPRPSMAR